MLKILHCIPTLGGGGCERQLALLVNGQIRSGIKVYVVSLRGGANLKLIEAAGANVIQLHVLGNHDPRVVLQIAKLVRLHRIDLVQTWLPQMDVFGGLASLLARTPYILSEGSCREAYPTSIKHVLRKIVGRFANAVVANSLGGLQYWQGINNSPLNRVIRNGVYIDKSYKVNDARNDDKGDRSRRLLYAGRYISSKNPMTLLRALALVVPKFSDFVVDFHGEGPLANEMQLLRDELGLQERVVIGGYFDPLVVKLRETNIFISPSMFEGNPNTVVEAAACGCTLVLSDIPAHREFLDDSCAYFVKYTSSSSIAEGIEQALLNPEEAMRKGAAAFDRVSGWTVGALTNQFTKLYQDVLIKSGLPTVQ